MRRVSYPIHDAQTKSGSKSVAVVIFDYNILLRHSLGFPQQDQRIDGMMQNVEQEYHVESIVGVRDTLAVELDNRDLKLRLRKTSIPSMVTSGLCANTISSIRPSPQPTSSILEFLGINSPRCLTSTLARRCVTNRRWSLLTAKSRRRELLSNCNPPSYWTVHHAMFVTLRE